MPKKTKTEQTTAAAPAEAITEPISATEAPAVKKTAVTKKSASKTASGKSSAKKSAAKKSPKSRPARSTEGSEKRAVEPTDEQIRIRAYFIAERRSQMSLEGDPNNDWIQAREELIAELGGQNGNGSH